MGDGKRKVDLYVFQAETTNTFLSRTIAMNGVQAYFDYQCYFYFYMV